MFVVKSLMALAFDCNVNEKYSFWSSVDKQERNAE
jgi:hypothetical protein